ncbi:LysR family transcriptional regulator [Trinickia mobilis]|uniref:LysR family transcriptional regulator n=1 Tax=Trinickia mobilis TaxID=2816356 RepID=UPI001A8C13C6|nr:LysR family transcriptional regulator [Trinickia mobilis]
MDIIEGMSVFVRVAQSGSFSTVARELGLTQPSVSKQIAALENHLGVRLLNRTTRHLQLTEDGFTYLSFAQKILDTVAEAEAHLGGAKRTPRGLIRIGSPYAFAQRYLVRCVGDLLEQYPQLRVEIVASDMADSLVEHGLDVAIRFGNPNGDLVARQAGTTSRIAVASPAYLESAGEPQGPLDLSTHNCLVYSNPAIGPHWSFLSHGCRETVVVSGSFVSNSADVIREACIRGLGITVMPNWLFHDDLTSGRVCQVLRQYEPEGLPIFVVYPSRKFVPPKLRVVVDYLATELGRDPALNVGLTP